MTYALASLRISLQSNGQAYYAQLVQQIYSGVQNGELLAGDKLPSSRSLAQSLGVSRTTITRAYDQLISEGVLRTEQKKGVFVALSKFQAKSVPTIKLDEKTVHSEPSSLRFDSGVDVGAFPNKEWASSMRRSWLNPDVQILQGSYTTGYPPLKAAIADYLKRVRGLDCATEQIIITAGSRDSLILLQHALSRRGRVCWWLEEATYSPMREVLQQITACRTLTVDQQGAQCPPTIEHTAEVQQVSLVTPNRQYPLGMSMDSERRQQWLQQLQTPNHWVVEDDYDNEFVYYGRPERPFTQAASLYAEASSKVLFVGSFSKVMFRGLRVGYIVAPPSLLPDLQHSQQQIGLSASQPIQPALADFILQGRFDRHINRMRRHYKLKRDVLLDLLKNNLSDWFEWQVPSGGMHVLVKFKAIFLQPRTTLDLPDWIDKWLAEDLKSHNIQLSSLSSHYAQPNLMDQGFVMGFSAPKKEEMLQIIEIMKKWLQLNLPLNPI